MEKRDNSGALFKNDKKQSESHPDYRGPCMVNGKEMEVSAWEKTAKSGVKFWSLAFQEPYKPKKYAGDDDTRPRGRQSRDDLDLKDDIPF